MGSLPRCPGRSDGGRTYLDRIIDAINHHRRRLLLYHLSEADQMDIEEAAKRVAADELDADPTGISDDDYERVLTSLYHGHVPRLKHLGIVDYDRRSGDIRLRDPPEELDTFLDLTRSLEERDRC